MTELEQERARRAFVIEPESLTVGELNQAVKDLREELYQQTIRAQKAETALREAELELMRVP